MKTKAVLPVLLLVCATLACVAAAQDAAKVDVKGAWETTISQSARAHAMPAGEIKQQWALEQNGAKITGTVKDPSGDLSLAGNLEGLNGDVFRGQITNRDDTWFIQATVVGNTMSGTIRSGKDKVERLLTVKRPGAAAQPVVAKAAKPTPSPAAKAACIGCSPDGKATPRTADGHPDLSGFWDNPPENSGHVSARGGDGSVLFDFAGENYNQGGASEAANCNPQANACIEMTQNPNQPPYKPEYAAKVNAIYATAYGGSTPQDPIFDCKPNGIPRGSFGTMEIVQTPQMIAILSESPTDDRIIYLDGRGHPADLDTSYMGDSIGHWEGNTLVVDVAGLNDETWLGGSLRGTDRHTAIHSDQEHVVERWTRDGDTLTYEATVEDPVMFTKPWVLTPRHIKHAPADDYLLQFHCITEDKSHIIQPTENDPYLCVYCTPTAEAKQIKKEKDKEESGK